MAYQVKREKKFFVEDLELLDVSGTVVRTIRIELDPDSVVVNLSEKYILLLNAQRDTDNISNNPEELQGAYQKVGNAVITLFQVVFGVDNTNHILEFYENNYIEMVKQIGPFIGDVVIPTIRNMAQKNKQDILSKYNRKTRRKNGW